MSQKGMLLPPLSGIVTKTLRLDPYRAANITEALKLGKFKGSDKGIEERFGEDEVGLTKGVSVNLVRFSRAASYEELIAWGQAENQSPILPKHLLGIGIQYPLEQLQEAIIALGSRKQYRVLGLGGRENWRPVCQISPDELESSLYLFGFISP